MDFWTDQSQTDCLAKCELMWLPSFGMQQLLAPTSKLPGIHTYEVGKEAGASKLGGDGKQLAAVSPAGPVESVGITGITHCHLR